MFSLRSKTKTKTKTTKTKTTKTKTMLLGRPRLSESLHVKSGGRYRTLRLSIFLSPCLSGLSINLSCLFVLFLTFSFLLYLLFVSVFTVSLYILALSVFIVFLSLFLYCFLICLVYLSLECLYFSLCLASSIPLFLSLTPSLSYFYLSLLSLYLSCLWVTF